MGKPERREKKEKKERNAFARTHDRPKFQSFLRSRRKPQKGELAQIDLPEKKEGEDEIAYANRCYEAVGVRPTMTGPMKMPKPNKPCPCGAKYDNGKPKKFKKCCGKGA